jgi:DNA-binding FadR family transcriptional regulator
LKKTALPADSNAHEPRLYRVVADRIQELIRNENIAAGERLPSERDLATKLSVSRASLREALIAGTGRRDRSARRLRRLRQRAAGTGRAAGSRPRSFEVLSARRLIESEIAAIAARVATDSAIDAILQAVVEMEKHHADYSSNEQADRNFHLAIARATGNSALVGSLNYLWDQRGRLWHKLKEHFQTEELRQETLKDHRRILEAIAAHDPAAARKAMRAHLKRVTRTFSRG